MAAAAELREAAFGGKAGLERGLYDSSSWVQTVVRWEPRAFDRFAWPLLLVSAFSVMWTVVANLRTFGSPDIDIQSLAMAYSLVLTTVR